MENIVVGNITILSKELDVSAVRSQGPGGQSVNKLNTKVIINWDAKNSPAFKNNQDAKERFFELFGNKINKNGILQVSSQKTKSQNSNLKCCLEKIQTMLEKSLVIPKKRKPIKISLTARQKRREERIIVHRKKQERLKNKCRKNYDD